MLLHISSNFQSVKDAVNRSFCEPKFIADLCDRETVAWSINKSKTDNAFSNDVT